MTDTSKKPRMSGSAVSDTTEKSVTAVPAFVRLKSLSVEGGDNPGNGIYVPKYGQIFEANAEQGQALVACGLAELVKE